MFEDEVKQFPDHVVIAVAENSSAPHKSRLAAMKEMLKRKGSFLVHENLADLYAEASLDLQSAAKHVSTTAEEVKKEPVAAVHASEEKTADVFSDIAAKAAEFAAKAKAEADKKIAESAAQGHADLEADKSKEQAASTPAASVTTKTLNADLEPAAEK